jgi:hypothetical protein
MKQLRTVDLGLRTARVARDLPGFQSRVPFTRRPARHHPRC